MSYSKRTFSTHIFFQKNPPQTNFSSSPTSNNPSPQTQPSQLMPTPTLPPHKPHLWRLRLNMLALSPHSLHRHIRTLQIALIRRIRQILYSIHVNRLDRTRLQCYNWHRWGGSGGRLGIRRRGGLGYGEEGDGGEQDVVGGGEVHGGGCVVGENLAEFGGEVVDVWVGGVVGGGEMHFGVRFF